MNADEDTLSPPCGNGPEALNRRRRSRRARVILTLFALFLLIGAGAGAWWYLALRFEESTDDAYVSGNVLRIMPEVGGKVVAVEADDNDWVEAGQPLVRIDPVDAKLAFERSLVGLASAVRETCRLEAQLRESDAAIRMRKVDLRQQTDNLARREVLGRSNAIGTEELRHARDSRANAASALAVAEERRNALAAVLLDTGLDEQPAVRQAAETVRDCWLALRRTTLRSPASGQIAKRSVQAGEVVSPGTPLMTVIPLDHVWIDANFKEVQLRNMRIGQPAAVRMDLYGGSVVYRGRVAGFSAGTGSAFSLLPPQNATGNWIKIVQRVPVRIDLDPADLREHPLLVGLSALVEVDTTDASGPLLASGPRTEPLPAELGSRAPGVDFAPVEEVIAAVIRDNALPGVRPVAKGAAMSGARTSGGGLEPLQGGRLALATIGISVVTAMTVLDSTIANVALPTIAGNLGVASSQGTWVITFFGVANAIAIPLTGWLARRFGEVRLYFWSTFLFVAASFLCGVSSSLGMLIAFRIVQGAAAGPLIPLSQSLLLACYPHEKRGIALSLWSMTIVLAPILGPILGGYICDNSTWHWIFFVNVPVGFVSLFLLRVPLEGRETPTARNPIDAVGLGLLIVGVGCLQLMLDEGKDKDWFASGYIVILGVCAVIGLVLLVVWELTEEHPVVDLSLFRHRNFAVGTVCISLGFLLYFAAVVLLPMMLQTRLGYTALWAGLSLAPVGVFPVLLAPIIGRFASRLDMRIMVTLSFIVFAICFFWRTRFAPNMDFAFIVWPQFVQGIGVALFFMPLTSIIISGLGPRDIANASSLSNCTRVLAGSIGSSIATTVWERQEALHHVRLTEAVNPFNPVAARGLHDLSSLGLSPEQAKAWIANEITRQGFLIGFNELFWLGGVLFLCLAGLVWLSTPIHRKGHA